jgi:membrane protein
MEHFRKLALRVNEWVMPGVRMYQENRIAVYAGYSTLFISIALIPFIVLIISVVNLMPGFSAEDVTDILLQILPDLKAIENLIVSLISTLKEHPGKLLASVAALTTLWSSSKGVMAIQKALNELDNRTEDDETIGTENSGLVEKGIAYARLILKRLISTVTLIALIPAILVIKMLGNSTAGKIGAFAVLLVALLVVLQFFAKLPVVQRSIRSQLPGALLTVLGWGVFTVMFTFFISRSYRYSNFYGTLAAVFLLVLWMRYMVMILFGGAVLNRVLESKLKSAHIF